MATFELIAPGPGEKNLIKEVERLVRKDKPCVQRRVFCFKGDRESLVQYELAQIESATGEMYTTVKHFGVTEKSSSFGQVINYRHSCERNARPTGRFAQCRDEKVLSKLTRANSCNAYVSHQFVWRDGVQMCIQRIFAEHSGHDPHNPVELCRARLSKEVVDNIFHWFSRGLKPKQVSERCEMWARSQGYLDCNNRRYYPSKVDVRALHKVFRKKLLNEQLKKSGGIDKFCETDYKDHVVYFQDGDENYSVPMLAVLQSNWQFEQFKKFGNGFCILSATFNNLSTFGYSLYSLFVKNERNKPVAVAFCLMSDENEDLIHGFLSKLRAFCVDKGFCWRPQAVMVDTDWKEIHALNRLFNDQVPVLLCWFRMLQVVLRWTVKEDSSLKFDKCGRHSFINFLFMLKQSSTENEFNVLWNKMIPQFSENIVSYVTDTWKPIAKLWANYGRLIFRCSPEANRTLEQMFCVVKWQFLKHLANHPIDELLQILVAEVLSRSSYVSLLAEPGKLSKTDLIKQNEEIEMAKSMLARGDGDRVLWNAESNSQTVPSESDPDVSYMLNVAEMWCSCSNVHYGVKCKHLCLAELCCNSHDTDIDELRQNVASRIFAAGDYQLLDNIFMVVNSVTGFVNCVDVSCDQCVCPASTYGVDCLCRKILLMSKVGVSSNICPNTPSAAYPLEEQTVDISTTTTAEASSSAPQWSPSKSTPSYYCNERDEKFNDKRDSQNIDFDDDSELTSLTPVNETKLLCENILAKLNGGWTPPSSLMNTLRNIGDNESGDSLDQQTIVVITSNSVQK